MPAGTLTGLANDWRVTRSAGSPTRLGSVVGADSPSPLGLHSAVLRALLDPRLSPACFLVRSSEWLPQVPPVAPGRSASSAPLVAVERPERSLMDFLGALGRDCTAESDPAPRPLPPTHPAASVPVAPPASADQIRRRFEDQQRELARCAGRSLSPPEPLRSGAVLRSGAEAVAHQERSPRRRSSAARDDKRESRRDDHHGAARSLLSPRSPRRVAPRSRSRNRRSHRHRSPPPRSSRQRSPARQTFGRRPPAPRSPPPTKRQRLYSPRRGDRFPGRRRQQGPSRPQSPVRSSASGRARRGRRGGDIRGGKAGPAPSAMERRLLDRLDDVEKELRRSRARSASPSAPRAPPVVPLSALLPHNPFGSLARSEQPLPTGTGFVGAGGGLPWAQFAPPRPLPAPHDLAVSSHRARAYALLPPTKEVPTATLARLWSLAASLQSLERILQESFDSMPLWLNTSGMLAAVEADRMKFTDRFHQNFLRKHLGAAAFSRPLILLDGHSQPLLCQDFKQQQQQQRSEGVGAAALTFGGLSYQECMMAFLAPNARCCLPATQPNLSSLATPLPASQTPFPASETTALSAAAASTTEFPFSRDAVPVVAASSAAALCRAVKRPRDNCVGRGADQRLPGGCDSRLVRSGLVRDGLVQGGMRVDWPHVASESARDLPHDPLAPLPTAMASPLSALPGSAPGSTSSCIAEILAGSTCGCGTEEQEYVDACIIVLDNGSSTDNNRNGTDNNDNSNSGNDNQSDRDKDALFLDTPMAHLLLAGSALAVPLASGPQAQGPAPPGAAGPPSRAVGSAVAEWAAEQGGAGEAGADWHRQQQGLTQEATLAQWKACGCVELDPSPAPSSLCIPSQISSANPSLPPFPLSPLPVCPSPHRVSPFLSPPFLVLPPSHQVGAQQGGGVDAANSTVAAGRGNGEGAVAGEGELRVLGGLGKPKESRGWEAEWEHPAALLVMRMGGPGQGEKARAMG
ncbi:unnamed protein product [Closterium sp. NIES-64]|nr:unnamed protein product [Closterium sp. NIES-64]